MTVDHTSRQLSSSELEAEFERQRSSLMGYCYRMLGSSFDADDAVQDTYVRAWRAYPRFDGRAPLRAWMHRIATNVCIDMLNGRRRRALPMDLTEASSARHQPGPALPESTWVQPIPDRLLATTNEDDPANRVAERATIRLAFVAALQTLPSRQRAVLILRDVLRWSAAETAELLGVSLATANGLLRRARTTMRESGANGVDSANEGNGANGGTGHWPAPSSSEGLDAADHSLLERYVDAFQRYDVDAMVSLLHADATIDMPPQPFWLRGADELRTWWQASRDHCSGSTLIPTRANGGPAFGQYLADGRAFAVQLIAFRNGRISSITSYIDETLFPLFDLPLQLVGHER